MDVNLWSNWAQVGGSVVRAVVIYVVAVVAVRIAGRRTLAQMSAFDIVVTIALGTLVASSALPSRPAVVDGVAVLLTLLGLQVSIATLRQRFPGVQRVTDYSLEVLLRDGKVQLHRGPFTAQVTHRDLEGKLRQHGMIDIDQLRLVILETGGQISVLAAEDKHGGLFDRFLSGSGRDG